jgi:uncharacterized membrane protein
MDHEQWLKMHDEWLELHNRAIAEHDQTIAECDRLSKENAHDIRAMNRTLRQAIAAAVREARNERRKRQELDDKLSAAQLITEEKLQRFIDSLRQGGNGSH